MARFVASTDQKLTGNRKNLFEVETGHPQRAAQAYLNSVLGKERKTPIGDLSKTRIYVWEAEAIEALNGKQEPPDPVLAFRIGTVVLQQKAA